VTIVPDRIRSIMSDDVCELAGLFSQEGHDLYLVGGSVRDGLLGREGDDLDFATGARPQDIERIGEAWANSKYLTGKAFGTIGLVKDRCTYEITGHLQR